MQLRRSAARRTPAAVNLASMVDFVPPVLQPLDEPLPAEIAGSGHSWFTRYRIYPVFSRAWGWQRSKVWLSLVAAVLLLVLLLAFDRAQNDMPWGGFVQMAFQLVAPILIGPWLGARIRRHSLTPTREWWALVLAMSALVLAMLVFHQWGAEPIKQWVAERTGAVDEMGKRRRVVMAIGVSILTPERAAAAGNNGFPPELDPVSRAANALSSAVLTFWLGGGAGLWGWRRQRDGLAALAGERELAQAQASRRAAELRLSVLAAQVEPHFLFNTMAGVRSAIRTDPGRATDMIDHLVDYLRAAIPRLRGDGSADATLGGQLDIVRAYLGLMRARMPRLSFQIDAEADLLGAAFPPLMLISLAENAVKHGVEPKIGPVNIVLRARRTDDGQLALTVADDGAGFSAETSAGGGLGLSNIRQRLQQIYGDRGSLKLQARPGGGVAATITVPLE
jgi:signal transduction histidine kinase